MGARADARYCSTPCRQAAHRFNRATGRAERADPALPMRFAYADPPYPGMAHLYRDHPDYRGEVDHRALVEQLVAEYPDGWALSTSAAALADVLELCPRFVRVAAWVRGHRENAHPRGPLSSWEPVIYSGGREGTNRPDSLVYVARARLTDPDRVIGAKPATFARWLFQLLGATPDDTLADLFPGSGGITRAWAEYTRRDAPALFDA